MTLPPRVPLSVPLDVIYRRFAIAGLLLLILPAILLLPDEPRGDLAVIGVLALPAGGLVAISAAWKARRGTNDWRVALLVSGTVLMGFVALTAAIYAVSAPERGMPDFLELGLLGVTVVFPVLALGIAGWWFLWAWRRPGS